MQFRNEGVGGSESPDVARTVLAYAPRPGDVVAIEATLNDVRRLGDTDAGRARYRVALDEMLRHLARAPSPPIVLLLLDPPITAWTGYPGHERGSIAALAAYATVACEVAAEHKAQVVELRAGWNLAEHLSFDGVHPSTAGMQHIADAVVAAIRVPGQPRAAPARFKGSPAVPVGR